MNPTRLRSSSSLFIEDLHVKGRFYYACFLSSRVPETSKTPCGGVLPMAYTGYCECNVLISNLLSQWSKINMAEKKILFSPVGWSIKKVQQCVKIPFFCLSSSNWWPRYHNNSWLFYHPLYTFPSDWYPFRNVYIDSLALKGCIPFLRTYSNNTSSPLDFILFVYE